MTDLFRAYSARLLRHKMFIGGTILAFIITYYFTANGTTIHEFGDYQSDFDYSLTVSIGIPAFFSLFIPFFLGAEYTDGTVRNKLAAGKTRTDLYAASFAAMALALVIMTAAWLAGALIGANTLPDAGEIVLNTVKLLVYNLAVIALLVMLSMMITKQSASIVIQFTIFQMSAFAALTFQGLMTVTEGKRYEVLKFLLNFDPYGQWLTASQIGDKVCMMSAGTQMGFSLFIAVVLTAAGVIMLQKKDIK
ncbi:MAG: ABC transporter permease subunit [Ruminococcus sp.]|nr:ABC transporter permease subunit [Ruminococcus sp.]